MSRLHGKIKEIFSNTIESELRYGGNLNDIDFYELMCKSAANDSLYNVMGCNVCMFNMVHDENPAILIVFAIPINANKEGTSSHVSERVMEVLRNLEMCFITLDYVNAKEVKEDNFVYLTSVKVVN